MVLYSGEGGSSAVALGREQTYTKAHPCCQTNLTSLASLPNTTQPTSLLHPHYQCTPVHPLQRVETQPGLHTFADDSKGLETKALGPLISWAHAVVPPRQRAATPVLLLGTGGLRRLGAEAQERLLGDAHALLKLRSGFAVHTDGVRVISGVEEAVYGWVALNYERGTLANQRSREDLRSDQDPISSSRGQTVGALDLGGSSLEVAFELPNPPSWLSRPANVSLAGVTYHLHTHAFHSFGLNEAFDRAVGLLLADAAAAGRQQAGEEQPHSGAVKEQQEEEEKEEQQQQQQQQQQPGRSSPRPPITQQEQLEAGRAQEPVALTASTAAPTPSPFLAMQPAAGAVPGAAHLSPAQARTAAAGLRSRIGSGAGGDEEDVVRSSRVVPEDSSWDRRRQLLSGGDNSSSSGSSSSVELTSPLRTAAAASFEFGSTGPAWLGAAALVSDQPHRQQRRLSASSRVHADTLPQHAPARAPSSTTAPATKATPLPRTSAPQAASGDEGGGGEDASPAPPSPSPSPLPAMRHPCLHAGYSAPYARLTYRGAAPDPPVVRLVGEPDFEACVALAGRLVKATDECAGAGPAPPGSACVLGALQPQLRGSFTAITGGCGLGLGGWGGMVQLVKPAAWGSRSCFIGCPTPVC